tara:strand:+ start:18 stop:473 length:456 start_codon:yes stop_codon:yes gene_type:complete
MALSKPLKASLINVEGGRASGANAPLGGATGTAAAGSLVKLFENASPSGVSQSSPYAYSDFEGKSFSPPLVEFPITASTFANPLFACFQSTSSNSAFFPNGAPTINDVVYANAAGSVLLGAGNWGVNASSTQSNFRMTIDSNGKITAYNPC